MSFSSSLTHFLSLPQVPFHDPVGMSGGSPQHWRSGIANSLDSLTVQPEKLFNIQRSHNSSDGEADNGHTGFHAPGPSSGVRTVTTNVGQSSFAPASSNQGTTHDLVLDPVEQFEDAPYVPPRITQAELQAYAAFHPRTSNVYEPPNYNLQLELQQYQYEGSNSPCESHQSLGSNWSTSSSSSAPNIESPLQYSQPPVPLQPTTNPHYPAYYGQHRLGLEHVRCGDHPSNTGGTYYRPHQGCSVNGLLSPEAIDDVNTNVVISSRGASQQSSSAVPATNRPPNISTFSISPTDDNTRFQDAGPYLRKQLGLSASEPVSLYSLPDPPPGEKPSAPLPILVKLAIYGSPHKQLTLQEIYMELEKRFQWFRDHKHDKAWKNSIRHNLSLNKVFRSIPRPITEPGKGSYWRLDISGGEGYKRPRKRRPKNRMAASEEEEEEEEEVDEDRQSSLDILQHPGASTSAMLLEDAYIDPELRGQGHLVGEGRTRSSTRRTGGGIPYPSPSPHIPQGPSLIATGHGMSPLGLPSAAPGQPSFGRSSFPAHPQTQLMPTTSSMSSSSFAVLSSPMITRPHVQHMASYDRAVQIPQLPLRSSTEYLMGAGGLPAARPVSMYPESQGQSRDVTRSSTGSPSSGSSQTWRGTQSIFPAQDDQ